MPFGEDLSCRTGALTPGGRYFVHVIASRGAPDGRKESFVPTNGRATRRRHSTEWRLPGVRGPVRQNTRGLAETGEEGAHALDAFVDDVVGYCVGEADVLCGAEGLARDADDVGVGEQAGGYVGGCLDAAAAEER